MAYGFEIRKEGLYWKPGDIYIDPLRPVERAIVTHGHADHARRGHGEVWATPETMAIMCCRYGEECARVQRKIPYGETVQLGSGATLRFAPAGHVLGSAQAVLECGGHRTVITGDFKRGADPTCAPFEVVNCDVFVTEATFALPVFHHPPVRGELQKLLDSMRRFPQRAHLLGVYGLGKCQRVMAELRAMGFSRNIYLHGAMVKLCELYEELGVKLGPFEQVTKEHKREDFVGELVLCPPGALEEQWSRRFPDPVRAAASGWMRIRARAKQKRVELPLIISDHADWPELLQTISEVNPKEVWVTHGREDALVYMATQMGYKAQALNLIGYDETE